MVDVNSIDVIGKYNVVSSGLNVVVTAVGVVSRVVASVSVEPRLLMLFNFVDSMISVEV